MEMDLWSVANLTLTAVDTDVLGVTPFLDENKIYILCLGKVSRNKLFMTVQEI